MTGAEPQAWGTGQMNSITYVGLDVHKATIAVAVAEGRRGGEVRHLGVFPNRPDHIAKLVERLGKNGRRLSFCYEAGPCGYGLHRQLTELDHDCIVVAPSLIPVKAGDRVKTDRRDAIMLAKLHRAGELTSIWVRDDAHRSLKNGRLERRGTGAVGLLAGFSSPVGVPARACTARACLLPLLHAGSSLGSRARL